MLFVVLDEMGAFGTSLIKLNKFDLIVWLGILDIQWGTGAYLGCFFGGVFQIMSFFWVLIMTFCFKLVLV